MCSFARSTMQPILWKKSFMHLFYHLCKTNQKTLLPLYIECCPHTFNPYTTLRNSVCGIASSLSYTVPANAHKSSSASLKLFVSPDAVQRAVTACRCLHKMLILSMVLHTHPLDHPPARAPLPSNPLGPPPLQPPVFTPQLWPVPLPSPTAATYRG